MIVRGDFPFKVSKYCVIRTSCITSCGVDPGTVLAKSSTESFKPVIIAFLWVRDPFSLQALRFGLRLGLLHKKAAYSSPPAKL